MPLTVADQIIKKVIVIDDNPSARAHYEYPLEELGLEIVYEEGPVPTIKEEANLDRFRQRADAMVCDYHLRKKNFSLQDGDHLVAFSNRVSFPALLCTTYTDSDLTLMRSKRRFIPSLLKPTTFDPETITVGFQRCILESRGEFESSRRPWRTLVRVADVEAGGRYFYVVVPGWNKEEKIRVYLDDVPKEFPDLVKIGARFHASVNLGANSPDELYFTDWENS